MPRFILHEDRKPRVEFIFILWVRDVNAYYEELNERGTRAEIAPTTQPYGIREFGILDLNGVSIVFGSDDELT